MSLLNLLNCFVVNQIVVWILRGTGEESPRKGTFTLFEFSLKCIEIRGRTVKFQNKVKIFYEDETFRFTYIFTLTLICSVTGPLKNNVIRNTK